MTWHKHGLVFDVKKQGPTWAVGGALTPTPVNLNDETIRVFCGFRNAEGVSRIGYVDVDSANPKDIIGISSDPCLNLGERGTFDDNGQILGHIEKINGVYHLYYIGFQLVKQVKFLAFTGLALSEDLLNFKKYSPTPILDRSAEGIFINAIHSVVPYKSGYLVYFAAGRGWEVIEGKEYPQYEIYETFSQDGKLFDDQYRLIVPCDKNKKEYRIGRPSAFIHENRLKMFFTKGSTSGKDYFPGCAIRTTAGNWERNDALFDLNLSSSGFDSIHLCYPRFIETRAGKKFIFYNGNNMGAEGFGCAELIDD